MVDFLIAGHIFKSISDGQTRHIKEPKNEEKDRNSSNVSLFT